MKIRSAIAIALLIALPSVAAAAQQVKPGPYASAFLGVSMPQDTHLKTDVYDDFQGTHDYYNDKVEFNPGIFVGGTGGYDFGIIRLEGELSYKYNEIDSVNNISPGYYYMDDKVGTFAFMGNMFIDLHNDSPVTPYFGGGIGIATIYIDNNSYDYYDDEEDSDTVFAYQLGGGLEIAINRQLSLDVGYRYFATESAEFDMNWYPTYQHAKIKLESHNVAVGVRFKF